MQWAITLTLNTEKTIEQRALRVIEYIIESYKNDFVELYDLEGNGTVLYEWIKVLESSDTSIIFPLADLLHIFQDGQVFELDLIFRGSPLYRLIIRVGSDLDVLGDGERIPHNITGDYIDQDLSLYLY